MGQPIGRNEPCPCGSGKKFKKCCGVESSGVVPLHASPFNEPVTGLARAHAIWPRTREILRNHALDWLGESRLVDGLEDCPLRHLEQGLESEWASLVESWQLYDWIDEDEELTIAEHFLKGHSMLHSNASADARKMIASANANSMSVFQVQSIDRGRGVVLKDLLTHEERFVVDKSLSASVAPWTVLLARLVSFDSITFFDAVAPRPLAPDWADHLVESIEEAVGQTIPFSHEFLRQLGDDVVDCYAGAIAKDDEDRKRPPILKTTDGEHLVICVERWSFQKSKRRAVIKGLVELGFTRESAMAEPEVQLAWVRENAEGPMSSTTLGRISVGTTVVRIETNSRERRDRIKAQVADHLATLLTHIDSNETSQEELLAQSAVPTVPSESVPPEIAANVMREYLRKHYSTWPDYPIPALNGKSPREAMETKMGRTLVEALIRDMEHKSHGTPMQHAYDFDELRRNLGLPPARGNG
jgi:hypothetical protein